MVGRAGSGGWTTRCAAHGGRGLFCGPAPARDGWGRRPLVSQGGGFAAPGQRGASSCDEVAPFPFAQALAWRALDGGDQPCDDGGPYGDAACGERLRAQAWLGSQAYGLGPLTGRCVPRLGGAGEPDVVRIVGTGEFGPFVLVGKDPARVDGAQVDGEGDAGAGGEPGPLIGEGLGVTVDEVDAAGSCSERRPPAPLRGSSSACSPPVSITSRWRASAT